MKERKVDMEGYKLSILYMICNKLGITEKQLMKAVERNSH